MRARKNDLKSDRANKGGIPILLSGAILLAVVAGLAAGIGGYTFVYAKGYSYLSDNPSACDNCHVMNDQYDAWRRGPHHAVAVCNDCHTPHDFAGKYFTKALNGYHHSRAFTSGVFHEPIRIKARNRGITEAQCRRCHEQIVGMIDAHYDAREEISCLHCHSRVGHP